MKNGAFHYANKPFDLDEIVLLVEKALETTQLRREVRVLRARQAQPYGLDSIVGDSAAIKAVRALLEEDRASAPRRRCCSPARAAPARISPPR